MDSLTGNNKRGRHEQSQGNAVLLDGAEAAEIDKGRREGLTESAEKRSENREEGEAKKERKRRRI